MQHDNNIENKLREMEAMEQPDVSQMDAHWQEMAAMLQPAVVPVKKGWPRWMLNGLSVVAVAVLIGAALLYLSSKKNIEGEKAGKQNEVIVKENADATIVSATPLFTATDSAATNATTVFHQPAINASLINDGTFNDNAKKWTEEDSLLGTVKLNVAPCGNCDDTTVAGIFSNAERQLKLQGLFAQLEKQEQHFIINNSRDTLLEFEEGTALLIPANSFGGMNGVELTAKEFYETSDIVLNQLNTASNKEQLETGGMLQIKASYKGNKLSVDAEKPLTLFMADTSSNMNGMQLFNGQMFGPEPRFGSPIGIKEESYEKDSSSFTNSSYVNWIPKGQFFVKNQLITEVWVFNIVDEPFEVEWPVNDPEKRTAYFVFSDSIAVERKKLKQILKEKYGYHKVKLRPDFRNWFKDPSFNKKDYERDYDTRIGDSLWMEKSIADKYNLIGTKTRQFLINGYEVFNSPKVNNWLNLTGNSNLISSNLKDKFSINITELDWINCDRYYTDSRKKIQFKVDIGDSAANYYTMLVFDKLNSMMTGYINGNTVSFQNIPIGEPVKVISIGINQSGETVYSVTHTTTSEEGLKGLQFQTTSAPDLKASLSKIDN